MQEKMGQTQMIPFTRNYYTIGMFLKTRGHCNSDKSPGTFLFTLSTLQTHTQSLKVDEVCQIYSYPPKTKQKNVCISLLKKEKEKKIKVSLKIINMAPRS